MVILFACPFSRQILAAASWTVLHAEPSGASGYKGAKSIETQKSINTKMLYPDTILIFKSINTKEAKEGTLTLI